MLDPQYNSTKPTVANGQFIGPQSDSSGNIYNTLGSALDDVNDSITTYPKCSYTNISASALIKTGAGQAYAIVVNSYTATATIKLWDNTAGSGTVLLNTITIAATDRVIPLFGATFATGLYVTIAVAAADITILYR